VFWPVALAVGSSFYVVAEPAPTDVVFTVLLVIMLLIARSIRFPIDLNPVLTIGLFAFVGGSVLSLLPSQDYGVAVFYLAVTLYLVVTWYLVVTLLVSYGGPMAELILRAFVAAAVLAALVGVVSHFSTVVQDTIGLRPTFGEERTKSTFKDPNVYSPFLCAALLVVINDIVTRHRLTLVTVTLLCLFSVEILAAFSRGGYANLAVALFTYFVLLWLLRRRTWLVRFMVLVGLVMVLVVPVTFGFLQFTDLDEFLLRRLRLQAYDEKRFATQTLALLAFAEAPLGVGPGQSRLLLLQSPHNLYLRVAIENGVIALLGFCLFLATVLWISLRGALRRGRFQEIYICSTAILAGALVNSIVIDSLHWRHLFLFLALPVGLAHYERGRDRAAEAATGRAATTRS
jgi:O-antigen ligase